MLQEWRRSSSLERLRRCLSSIIATKYVNFSCRTGQCSTRACGSPKCGSEDRSSSSSTRRFACLSRASQIASFRYDFSSSFYKPSGASRSILLLFILSALSPGLFLSLLSFTRITSLLERLGRCDSRPCGGKNNAKRCSCEEILSTTLLLHRPTYLSLIHKFPYKPLTSTFLTLFSQHQPCFFS